MLNLIFINIIAATGLNILTGFAGLISLGHAAFMAIGAYASAILTVKLGLPFWLALPAAGVLTALVGFVVGLPSLRLTGIYLALATMAFGFITDEVIMQWGTVTGGANGLRTSAPAVLGFTFDSYKKYFFITFTSLAILLFIAKNVLRGGFGRTLIAIRDSETAAEAMGVNLGWHKTLAFTLSALYAGNSKPWRQKGTGQARAGSIRSPLWRKGGKTFPASPDENFSQKVNRKMHRAALRSIFSELARQNRLVAVDAFGVSEPKTRALVEKLAHFGTEDALILTEQLDRNLGLSARNLHKVDVRDVASMDPVALVRHEKVIVTVPALKRIQEMLGWTPKCFIT